MRARLASAGWLAVGWAVLVAALAWVYAPVRANGFVWDDWTNVVATRAARGFSAGGLRWAFTAFVEGHYQPLTWLSYALDERVFGGSAAGYHVTNVALHALNAGLFAVVAALLLGHGRPEWSARRRALVAGLAAAFFALHPLRVESVAWATERRDVLSACFVLAATACYLDGRRGSRGASVAFFALALLAKAQVMLPAVLLVLDVYPLRRLSEVPGRTRARALFDLALEKLPFFALSAVASVLALRAQAASGALLDIGDHPLPARVAQAAYGLVFYLRATLATAWSPLYERPVPLDPLEARFLLAFLACLSIGAACYALRRRWPSVPAAGAAYVLFLVPVLGVFQSGVQLVADRYAYLATLGFAVVAAAAVADVTLRARRAWLRAAISGLVVALLGLLAFESRRQVGVWRDDETLWRHVLAGGPSALAHNNLGQRLAARGEHAEAVPHLRRALEVVPAYARPWTALRQLLEGPSAAVPPAEARLLVPVLSRAVRWHRDSPSAHYTLGLALARAGDDEGALLELDRALILRPGDPAAAFARGLALERLERRDGIGASRPMSD